MESVPAQISELVERTADALWKDRREDLRGLSRDGVAAVHPASDLRQSTFDFCKVVHPALPSFGPGLQPRRRPA